MGLADRQPDPHEHSRRQQPPAPLGQGVGKDAAHQDAAGAGLTWLLTKLIVPW